MALNAAKAIHFAMQPPMPKPTAMSQEEIDKYMVCRSFDNGHIVCWDRRNEVGYQGINTPKWWE